MKQFLYWIYGLSAVFASVFFPACMKEVDLNELRKAPKLVLNSRLAAGDTVSARITRTWFYTENYPNVALPEAEVNLFVNGQWKERMNWDEADRRYMEAGCFLSSYRAASGDRIRLEVRQAGYEGAWAETIIPDTIPLLDVQFSSRTLSYPYHTEVITDYDIRFRDDPAQTNYYMLTLEDGSAYRADEEAEWKYIWTPALLDFSRDPIFEEQVTVLDKLFGYDGSSYTYGQVLTDALFDGKEYVLKVSSSFVLYNGATEYALSAGGVEAANGRKNENGSGSGNKGRCVNVNGVGNEGGREHEKGNGFGNKEGSENKNGWRNGCRLGNGLGSESRLGSEGGLRNGSGLGNGKRLGSESRLGNGSRLGNKSRREDERRSKKPAGEPGEDVPPRLRRFSLYSLTESYYLYLRSMIALEGSTFEGDLANMGLTAPVRVYSNIGGGGTGIVAAYGVTTLTLPHSGPDPSRP